MSQTTSSTRRRTAAQSRSMPAASPEWPEREQLTAVLQATNAQLWSATKREIDAIVRTAAKMTPFPLHPAAPSFSTDNPPVAGSDRQRVADFFAALPRALLPCSLDCRLHPTDRPRWVRLTVTSRVGPAATRRFNGVVRDITRYKKLEDEILRISEREQNRIGQDLHDDLCQVLAGLSCLTRVLENRLAPQVPHEVENLREINQQLVDAMERTRALTHGLYPAQMRSGDARPALLELAKQVEVRFGVVVKTAFRGVFPAHEAQEILQVYRIAQEAISNAIRHGGAKRIDLALERAAKGMCLSIRDNGAGFPAAQAPRHGIGLQIMHHRADQLGASIQIGNAPKRGALVVLHYQPVALL